MLFRLFLLSLCKIKVCVSGALQCAPYHTPPILHAMPVLRCKGNSYSDAVTRRTEAPLKRLLLPEGLKSLELKPTRYA